MFEILARGMGEGSWFLVGSCDVLGSRGWVLGEWVSGSVGEEISNFKIQISKFRFQSSDFKAVLTSDCSLLPCGSVFIRGGLLAAGWGYGGTRIARMGECLVGER